MKDPLMDVIQWVLLLLMAIAFFKGAAPGFKAGRNSMGRE